jgi:Flp pilus assembly pilin Flp
MLKKLMVEESGQDLIEYALLAGFISLIAVGAIELVGDGVNTVYTDISQLPPLAP